jgi:hypothetical protein
MTNGRPESRARAGLKGRKTLMGADTIHRIYTEEKNKRPILHLAAKSFKSFTVQPTLGYYRGRPEKSIVIEIIGASAKAINALARNIKKMNGQKSVLEIKLTGQAKAVRN